MESQPTMTEDVHATNEPIDDSIEDSLNGLRHAAMQTSNSILTLQRRAEEELVEAKQALEQRTEELAASLSLLHGTLESTADGIVAMDLPGRIISYNTKFSAIWHFPAGFLERCDAREMMAHAATQVKDSAGFLQLIKERQSAPETEFFDVVEMRDGRTFERYQFPQRVSGECVGIVVNFREVTERKRAEAALRLSEQKYRLLWATAGDAFVLFDKDNIILEANAAVATIFGYQPQEVIGQDISVLQPERFREGHRQGIERYLATGERKLDWRSAEVPGLHKDGREIPIEITFNHLHLDRQDLFAGFIRDITERKRAEADRARLAAIVNSSQDAIISKTLDGIITSWNQGAQNLFGYSAEEVIGKPILILIPPDHHDEEPAILARLRKGEGINHYETVRVKKNGELIHISLSVSPMRSADGTIIGASKIARDITGRKVAEAEREGLLMREKAARAEAEAANRAKDEFLAIVSHELRTPLNPMIGWAQMLLTQELDEAIKKQGYEAILRNAKVQARLVEDLLDVSRIVSGKMTLDIQSVDPIELVMEATSIVRPEADSKGVTLRTMLDSSVGTLVGDPHRLQQSIWNLLSNSIKFTPAGGVVDVYLERLPTYLQIRVRDTGIGISPDFLPHVFERLRQADSSSTRREGGLGLGLSIVRHMVELHGGTVQAESAGKGQGATFTIRLPLQTPDIKSDDDATIQLPD